MKTLRTRCPSCNVKMERVLSEEPLPAGYTCGRCETGVPLYGRGNPELNAANNQLPCCILCGNPYFYAEKDFPRPLAFTIVGIGALFTPWTYGISLFICGAIDLLFYLKLPFRRVCYLCKTEYRGFPTEPTIEPFDPHKGVAYDARRAIPYLESAQP